MILENGIAIWSRCSRRDRNWQPAFVKGGFGDEGIDCQRDQFSGHRVIVSGDALQRFRLFHRKSKFLRVHRLSVAQRAAYCNNNSRAICITEDYNVPQTIQTVVSPTLNVRFTEEQLAALREIATKNGVNVAQLVRWAVDALIRQVEENNGRLTLPIEFSGKEKKG